MFLLLPQIPSYPAPVNTYPPWKLLFWLMLSQIILPVLTFYVNGIIQHDIFFLFYVLCCPTYILEIQPYCYIYTSLLLLETYSIEWIYNNLVIHFPIDEHLHCLQFEILWLKGFNNIVGFFFLCGFKFSLILGKCLWEKLIGMYPILHFL